MRPIAGRDRSPISIWTRASRLALPLLLIVAIMQMVMMYITRPRYPSVGLRVRSVNAVPAGERAVLRVGRKEWAWKGLAIERKDFPGLLKQEFELRPDWVVYVDADPNVAASDVIAAVDMVQGAHGRTILVSLRNAAPRR